MISCPEELDAFWYLTYGFILSVILSRLSCFCFFQRPVYIVVF